jgi:diguanylate cyclase
VLRRLTTRIGFLGKGLARRLFGLFLLAALLPLALSDWISSAAVRQIAEQLDLQSRAQATRHVSRQVLDRLLAGKTLVAALPAADTLAGAPANAIGDGLNRVFRAATLLRDDGRVVWTSDPAADLAQAWLHADSAAPEARVRIGAELAGAATVELRADMGPGHPPRLLLGTAGHKGLRWIAEFEPAYLWQPLRDARDDSAWRVLDARGRSLASFRGADHPLANPADAMLEAQHDIVEHESRLFLFGEFGVGEWLFVQRAPRTEARWHGMSLGTWLALVALGTLLGIALLSHWQIRQTLDPLQQLTAGARRLSGGAADTRVAIRRDDEIGALAGAFNDMAERISAQFDALEGLGAIDREILAGAPTARLAELVLRQLQAVCPGAHACLSWRDGADGLQVASLHAGSGHGAPDLHTSPLQLDAIRSAAYDGIDHDETTTTAPPAAADADRAPWLPSDGLPAQALLPLRRDGRTVALLAITAASPLPPEQLQAARDLRDRLAVGRAARDREDELVHRAAHDSLTGLPNRYGLHSGLDALLGDGQGSTPLAVLFVDLDHFKDVNDSRGHAAGDALLCLAADRLRDCVPEAALVARQGGDEFAVLLPHATADEAGALAERIIEGLSQPFALRDGDHHLGASIGVSLCPEHGGSRAELLRCADIALYAAKAAGRGRHQVFTRKLDAAAHDRVQLQTELRLALQRGEFVAHYQPRVRPIDRVVTSAEALIRWQHPERGLLGPGAFIAMAEASGLIDGIGQWILDAACAQMAAWRAAGVDIGRVSVNVSPQQLASGELPRQVRDALDRHGLPASALELEVTESLLVGDIGKAHAQLGEIRRWGVTIALDDFGTGYSSMSTLRQLPIDVMKIDRAFIVDLGSDAGAMAITHAIVALARSLKLQLVAEGIETEAQFGALRSLGCDEMQGFLFSKPLAPAQFLLLPELGRHADTPQAALA